MSATNVSGNMFASFARALDGQLVPVPVVSALERVDSKALFCLFFYFRVLLS